MKLKIKRMIDLTQPIFDNCPGNPVFPKVSVKTITSYEKEGWFTECLNIATHISSHIDAPAHLLMGRKTIDKIPLERFQGPAVAIDLYQKGADEEIGVGDFLPHEARIQEGDFVLLCTGWGEKRAITDEYLFHSPWLNGEASKWLVDKKVNGVGIDHFSIGGANPDHVQAPHKILLEAEILILEELYLPEVLLERERWYLVAFPLKLLGASGSLIRAVAMEI
jgi:kynurenine formamidase